MIDDAYLVADIHEIESPGLIAFETIVNNNILSAIDMIGDVHRLMPHVKTHKSADVTKLMMIAGIHRFKCATLAEAVMLAENGANEVLIAYPIVSTNLGRYTDLIARFPHTAFACCVDNVVMAGELSGSVSAARVQTGVYLDINPGMNRTGIQPDQQAVDLWNVCLHLPGVITKGLHFYDGHIHEANIEKRKMICDDAYKALTNLVKNINDFSGELVVGGSPTFPIHAQRKSVTCSPGTFVFWDRGYALSCPEQPFVPAIALLTRVISKPLPNLFCLDVGHKAVAAENTIDKRIYFPDFPDIEFVGQSEEHLVVRTNAALDIGDALLGIPYHVCPTVALHDKMTVIREGHVSGTWPVTARGRSL